MGSKYVAYPEYKDSGVEWLGDVPKHWGCIKLKFVADLEGDKVEPSSKNKYVGMENIESWSGEYIEKADAMPEGLATSFTIGDVLFGKLRPYLAKSWLADFSGICSSEFLVLRSKKVSQKFLNYYSLTEEFIKQVDSSTYGSKMPRASWEFISLMGVPVPADNDSEKIANFLDHETAKIDTLIEKQQQLIKLLKEKRQAVISHAVTKGLNPNAPMRDSGVEWLGEVPEGWLVSALKYHVDTINGFGFSSSDFCEEGVPFIRAGNIKKKSITPTDLYLPQRVVNRYKRVILSDGDIVISMVGSDPRILESAVGQVGIVPKSMAGAVPNQNIVILREKSHSILKRFFFYTLCSEPYRNHLNVFSHKLANQSIISSSLIVNAKFMLPSTDEQKQIINFLDQRLVKIDEVVEKNYRSLELLNERRTALISAAVTGKIDVRNWVAPEPAITTNNKNKEAAP